MKSSDRFLIGIVGGIAILVIAAFVAVLTQPAPGYRADDSPEGVVNNYLLALQKDDYARAYGYLSPRLRGYPKSVDAFKRDIERNSYQFDSAATAASFALAPSRVTDDVATVGVTETRFQTGVLFFSSESEIKFDVELRRENSAWKITRGRTQYGTRYFLACWDDTRGCP
ncbi:MAG: hypothetical protein HY257_06220 [Chloroflexi bacterium]|nr:hypothetical protein [Chloroflexota bacterium]